MIQDEYRVRCSLPSDIVQHLPRLHEEASTGGATVIECGVRSGNSTSAFLAAVEEHDGMVYSVDITPPSVPWFGHPQWTFLLGDDLDLVGELPDCDVLFIDTNHHYRHTLAELEAFMPKVTPGGVALFHDTELEAPESFPPGDPAFPVRAALDEWCNLHGYTPEYVEGCYGLGVVRVPT